MSYIYNIMQDISKQLGDTWGYSLQTWEKYTRCELFSSDGATHHRSSNMAGKSVEILQPNGHCNGKIMEIHPTKWFFFSSKPWQ